MTGRTLREAWTAGQKVAAPIAAFALMGCCVLVGGGLLVSSYASPSTMLPPVDGTTATATTRALLTEADAQGLGFLLAMAALLAWGVWLHGHVAQKRLALRRQQQQHMALQVRSPGPMGA